MSEGTTNPLEAGLHVVEDPNYPQLYLMAEPLTLAEDPVRPSTNQRFQLKALRAAGAKLHLGQFTFRDLTALGIA